MTIIEASREACKQPSLIAALTYIAIWECERVVRRARSQPTWETCFRVCFEQVFDDWRRLEPVGTGDPADLEPLIRCGEGDPDRETGLQAGSPVPAFASAKRDNDGM